MVNKKLSIILTFCTICVQAQEVDSTLWKAYKYNSQILLDEFFMNWENSNKLSDEEKNQLAEKVSTDDTLKEVYAIVNSFYSGVKGEPKFFILYDTLKYKVCYADSIRGCDIVRDNIMRSYFVSSLRVETGYDNELYLNEEYINTFIDFFKNEYNSNDYNDWEKIGIDYDLKKTFLSSYLTFYDRAFLHKAIFFYIHYLLSKPYIGSITINKYLNSAIVGYSEGDSYYTALWLKPNGKWHYESTLTIATW